MIFARIDVLLWLSFGLTVLLGHFLLAHLRRLRVGQTVREDGPQTHRIKSGTPTFGGLMFLGSFLILGLLTLLLDPLHRGDRLFFLLAVCAFAGVGWVDDYVKVRIRKEGLSVRQKTGAMLLLVTVVTLYVLFAHGDPWIYLPFAPYAIPVTGFWKLVYGVFCVLYLYFCINAVNLTDGVDGLAATVVVTTLLSVVLAMVLFFQSPLWMRQMTMVGMGGCFGFLVYNRHPAKVFMGDTGSLALGTLVSLLPLMMGVPWVFAFVGFIYVIEALSVVLQVSFYKWTGGRRIFRMSPIHHHFELGGWTERQIVWRFALVNLVCSLLGLGLLVLTVRGVV